MNEREKLEADLVQARAQLDQAAGAKAKIAVDWRNADASVSYDIVRSNWTKADSDWNQAHALVERLTAALAGLDRAQDKARRRAALIVALDEARAERDRADAALAAVARARAERDKNAPAPARTERRTRDADRRKPGSDRRKVKGNRRSAGSSSIGFDATANEWSEAVKTYNRADAEWNRARTALADLDRPDGRR